MIANSPQPLTASDFDRLMLLPAMFQEAAQVWAIDPLLVHVCGTIYHSDSGPDVAGRMPGSQLKLGL